VTVINQVVVNINNPFVQVNITPPQSGHFAYAKTCADHDRKERIPVRIRKAVL
jgi:hypothetical protein